MSHIKHPPIPPGPADLLDKREFEIPRSRENAVDDFPTYLRQEFARYIAYYKASLKPYFEDGKYHAPVGGEVVLPTFGKPALTHIMRLADGLLDTVQYYYEGKLLQAMETFRGTLNDIQFRSLASTVTFNPGFKFYRTRVRSDQPFTRHDLFHNPFENRGRVATSRYSIPGLPALYLGTSTYVCWEEYGRERMENLFFSRFHNERSASTIRIQRLSDLLFTLHGMRVPGSPVEDYEFDEIASYLILFPLYLACSIRTRHRTDTFKPEYIIPQLLLQYVTTERGVSGIMFPSTRVNYSDLHGVQAYNFVFPVKRVQSSGHCRDLAHMFSLTEPTSIELESLMGYSEERSPKWKGINLLGQDDRTLTLTEGNPRSYGLTAFGYVERALASRPLCQLIT